MVSFVNTSMSANISNQSGVGIGICFSIPPFTQRTFTCTVLDANCILSICAFECKPTYCCIFHFSMPVWCCQVTQTPTKFQGEWGFCHCWQCFQHKVYLLKFFLFVFFYLTFLYLDVLVNYFLFMKFMVFDMIYLTSLVLTFHWGLSDLMWGANLIWNRYSELWHVFDQFEWMVNHTVCKQCLDIHTREYRKGTLLVHLLSMLASIIAENIIWHWQSIFLPIPSFSPKWFSDITVWTLKSVSSCIYDLFNKFYASLTIHYAKSEFSLV